MVGAGLVWVVGAGLVWVVGAGLVRGERIPKINIGNLHSLKIFKMVIMTNSLFFS